MLKRITPALIDKMNKRHTTEGGTAINDKLDLLFSTFPDNTCLNDVQVKVAVLNTIYNTSIQYIRPVAEKINAEFKAFAKSKKGIQVSPIDMVDRIATAEWDRKERGGLVMRTNLSFASKYMHFESKRDVPIYDSYIWIVMNGYLHAAGDRVTFGVPCNYADFYARFRQFRQRFELDRYSNYQIDKFLWQYGKAEISAYRKEGLSQAKAKARLQTQLLKAPLGSMPTA
ncbi:hypothetical protein [Massilia phyllosphaerae]|uniref:hypothetical protein n=1 Tax=Massilia phyllosphaerae TaxID=3106034 RepID=UPI002B1CBB6A|nr:hypothetical protein [Massilia sp. SGZ-792]